MYIKNEVHTAVFPTRIVKVQGNVTNPDVLLRERMPIPSLKEQSYATLEKTGEENPYVLLDFGRELHGSLRIIVAGLSKGDKTLAVHLTFGESVSEALSTVGKSSATNDHSPRDFDAIVSNLSAVDYGMTGFRFVRIELTQTGKLNLKGVVAVAKTASVEQVGYLRTSDERFNQILDTAIYTTYLNLQDGVIWDGIKRDRLVWSGDLNSEFLTLLYTYGPIEHIRNSLDFLAEATPEHHWMNTIPSYSAWWVINQLLYYRMSGDRAYLEAHSPRINSILKDLDVCIDADGADFDRLGEEAHMPYYLDWPTRNTPDAEPGAMLLIYQMAKDALSSDADGVDRACASSLVRKLERYLDAPVSMKQTLAIKLFCGGKEVDARARLEDGGAKGFSTFMSYYLLKGLSACGSERVKELAESYYGAMLDRGATTFWEDFDMDWLEGSGRIDEIPKPGEKDLHADYGKYCYLGLRHSFCHGWASGVVGWAFEEMLGLKVQAPGFAKVSITPKLFDLEWLEAKVPTPHGDILVSVKKGEKPVITLPEGVELV